MTTITTKPELTHGSGTDKLKRHIVQRATPGGPLTDKALCGYLWDRTRPMAGEMCEECVRIYQEMRPGWPIPSV